MDHHNILRDVYNTFKAKPTPISVNESLYPLSLELLRSGTSIIVRNGKGKLSSSLSFLGFYAIIMSFSIVFPVAC